MYKRQDQTTPIAVAYIVTDTFPGGTAVAPRYGEDRLRLDGRADYAVFQWLRAGIGGEYREDHYSPGQVLRNTQDVESWGRLAATPAPGISLALKYGDGLRKKMCIRDSDRCTLPSSEPSDGTVAPDRVLMGVKD